VLFFAQSYWQRAGGSASGHWQHVTLEVQGLQEQPGETHASVTQGIAPAQAQAPAAPAPQDDFPPGAYAEVVARAVQVLRAQPLVSLTLSQSFRRRVAMPASAAFARLRQVNPAPATFFFNTGEGECLFGASPDLQLALRGREIESLPVCGTVARGAGAVGEAESFRELLNEEVDAASLAVCSDALGNDLAPLCEPGSLQLRDRRRPMSLSTVVHTVDRLAGRLREGVDAWDAILATAAPVMLTGTPRALALAAIEKLEAGSRGWYGGMMVRVGGDGSALAGTILRAAVIRDGVAEVRTGGDLMADSDPPREERESRLKAVSLWRALGLPVEVGETDAGKRVPVHGITTGLPTAVALRGSGDPFPASVAHALRGLGVALQEDAPVRVLIGADAALHGIANMVAIGDAAARVLEAAGFAVDPIRPEHGRLLRCHPTPQAPWQGAHSFLSVRYATWSLRRAGDSPLPGWQVWAHDDAGGPVALAHAASRCVCLLFRPDSLLSDETAHMALQSALAFAARPKP
jgi:isochorismate synthase EntC